MEELREQLRQLQESLQQAETIRRQGEDNWQKHLLLVAQGQILRQEAERLVQDLSQPLSALTNYAEVLSHWLAAPDRVSNDELQRVLHHLTDQVTRAGQVLRKIRSVTKNLGHRRELCDLEQIIAHSISRHSHLLERNHVKAELVSRVNEPYVWADSDQLHFVLAHLIQYALESMKMAQAPADFIHLQLESLDLPFIEVSMKYSSPTILPADAAQLFAPSVIVEPGSFEHALIMCRAIVEHMGGKIRLAANPPERTEFRFTLPRASG